MLTKTKISVHLSSVIFSVHNNSEHTLDSVHMYYTKILVLKILLLVYYGYINNPEDESEFQPATVPDAASDMHCLIMIMSVMCSK